MERKTNYTFKYLKLLTVYKLTETKESVLFLANMNRQIKLRQFVTACLNLMLWSGICSQKLYETDYQQYNILNRESKEVFVNHLLDEAEALLKEKTSNLQDCVDKQDAYNNLLMLYSREQFPNGKNSIFAI